MKQIKQKKNLRLCLGFFADDTAYLITCDLVDGLHYNGLFDKSCQRFNRRKPTRHLSPPPNP